MTRNLKALGLALLAVFALGAIGAQGALAAVEHEFHSDGPKTVLTGTNVGAHEFAVGGAGIVKCTTATFESTVVGTQVGQDPTYKADTITVVPKYSNCEFGEQPATVNFNHCAYVFDSDTTTGNSTGGEHAYVEIECSEGTKVEVHTVNCTVTVGAQVVPDAVRYKNEKPTVPSAIEVIATAHNVVVGKVRNTAAQPVNGCLVFPTGAVGKYTGTATTKCFRDDALTTPEGTAKTTPPTPAEGPTTECTVSPGA